MELTAPVNLLLLPIGLGLIGFLEPCSVGSNLLYAKHLELRSPGSRTFEVTIFAIARAAVIGSLGVIAALAGSVFLGVQNAGWIALGVLYMAIGLAYASGRTAILARPVATALGRLPGYRGSAGMGLLFGLNVPVCSAPLILALLGTTTFSAAGAGQAFLSLGLFGLALSLPLVLLVVWPRGRNLLERLTRLSGRFGNWTGLLFAGLGLWSIYFGLYVSSAA